MKKMLCPIVFLLILLMTPLTVFAIPTANVSLLSGGPRDYNFEFENTTSDPGYDIYYIEITIPSDPVISNFLPPNPNWDYLLNVSTSSFTYDTSGDPANLIRSAAGCSLANCVGGVSFDTNLPVSEFQFLLYFTDPDPLSINPLEVSGTIISSVPEPSSMLLLSLGLGVIGILGYLRRFNRKNINSIIPT